MQGTIGLETGVDTGSPSDSPKEKGGQDRLFSFARYALSALAQLADGGDRGRGSGEFGHFPAGGLQFFELC